MRPGVQEQSEKLERRIISLPHEYLLADVTFTK